MKWDDRVSWSVVPKEWSDTPYECPEEGCDGIMEVNNFVVLTSDPPKRVYRCKRCGKIRYRQ